MGHLWLIGMMGTGKTTVGVIAAELTTRPFHDVDNAVMETTGKTIRELFEEGEDVFRRLESEAIEAAALLPPSVIATGGGAILSKSNVRTMRTTGTTVLLTAPIETIASRLASSHERPLATSPEDLAAIADLRLATYVESSDFVVETDGRSPHDVAEEVVACAHI